MSNGPQYKNIESDSNYIDDPRDLKDSVNHISTLISGLATDVGNLVTLQIDLLKVEMKESSSLLARNSIMLAAGGVLALFAFGGFTAALIALIAIWLPMSAFAAVATAAFIVGVVYAAIAGALVYLGLQQLKKKGLAPERSIDEIQNDKQLVKEIR